MSKSTYLFEFSYFSYFSILVFRIYFSPYSACSSRKMTTIPYSIPAKCQFSYSLYLGENQIFKETNYGLGCSFTRYYLYLADRILNPNPHYCTNVSYVTDISSQSISLKYILHQRFISYCKVQKLCFAKYQIIYMSLLYEIILTKSQPIIKRITYS